MEKVVIASCKCIFKVNNKKLCFSKRQKQSSVGALTKRCHEHMEQMHRRLPIAKCDFDKIAQ